MNGIDLHWMKDALYCSKTKPMHFGLAQDLKLISSFFFFFFPPSPAQWSKQIYSNLALLTNCTILENKTFT